MHDLSSNHCNNRIGSSSDKSGNSSSSSSSRNRSSRSRSTCLCSMTTEDYSIVESLQQHIQLRCQPAAACEASQLTLVMARRLHCSRCTQSNVGLCNTEDLLGLTRQLPHQAITLLAAGMLLLPGWPGSACLPACLPHLPLPCDGPLSQILVSKNLYQSRAWMQSAVAGKVQELIKAGESLPK